MANKKTLHSKTPRIYCDGGVISKNPSPLGGTWCWVLVSYENDPEGERVDFDCGLILPSDVGLEKITNNLTELYAAHQALVYMPKGFTGLFYTDSKVTWHRITSSYSFNGIPDRLS